MQILLFSYEKDMIFIGQELTFAIFSIMINILLKRKTKEYCPNGFVNYKTG